MSGVSLPKTTLFGTSDMKGPFYGEDCLNEIENKRCGSQSQLDLPGLDLRLGLRFVHVNRMFLTHMLA